MAATANAYDEAPPAAREAGLGVVALVVAVLVSYGWSLGFHLANAHNGLIAASWTAVGLYVVRMRPRHREGWLFVATGVVHAVMFFGRQYGLHEGPLPGASWMGWIGVWPLPLAIAAFGWMLMAFPDGRLLSRGWLGVAWGMVVLAGVMAAASALWPVEYDRTGLVAPHPFDVPGAAAAARVWEYAQFAYLLFQALGTVAIVVRLRRADGDETRRMRWLAYAVVMDLLILAAGVAILGSPVPGLLALPLVPVAAAFGILKHRLYDIDPVINKTIVVGAMLLLITAGYVALVVGVGGLARGVGGLVRVEERWLSLFATAVVAVVFEPLRRRAQRLADRLVYGPRATPYEALSRLSAQLAAAPEELLDGIAATVASALGAREVVVWVGDEACMVPRAGWPHPVGRVDPAPLTGLRHGPPWHLRPIVDHGTVRGAIAVRKPPGEPLTAAEERLLKDLVAQTGLVILQQEQAQELQSAARRIVSAGDAARRRLERDLHDGVQLRLVTLGMELGALAEQAKASGDGHLASRAKDARAQLLEATADLRELARGLHPMVLAQDGLEAALAAVADRSAIPVRLRVSVGGRLPREIEATAYYLVSESITNAARHSAASVVTVEVSSGNGGLRIAVTDDGRGGARPASGSGLQGLADRVAALGARLELDSPAGGGTRLRTVLPCG
ncbi:histidine kinase [Microbispora sp. NPDC049125]|uniref:sensor histidine kinase n=1 Tax=Microbispora sp. NPDC049125 TaxID=3154929 RepID=UPI003467A223